MSVFAMNKRSDEYRPIACGLYDYIELSCVYGYLVRVRLNSDGIVASVVGYALSTQTINGAGEFLQVAVDQTVRSIRLDHIVSMEALDSGASFGLIKFQS